MTPTRQGENGGIKVGGHPLDANIGFESGDNKAQTAIFSPITPPVYNRRFLSAAGGHSTDLFRSFGAAGKYGFPACGS